jgi:hypothetical protein
MTPISIRFKPTGQQCYLRRFDRFEGTDAAFRLGSPRFMPLPVTSNALKLTDDLVRLPNAAFRRAGGIFSSLNETKLANFSVSQNGVLVYRNPTTATPRGQQGPTS